MQKQELRWEMQGKIHSQQINLMAHIEHACEQRALVAPVEVTVAHANGDLWIFEYSPDLEVIDLPPKPVVLPINLTLVDAAGSQVDGSYDTSTTTAVDRAVPAVTVGFG
jgi:hypothetical protein